MKIGHVSPVTCQSFIKSVVAMDQIKLYSKLVSIIENCSHKVEMLFQQIVSVKKWHCTAVWIKVGKVQFSDISYQLKTKSLLSFLCHTK